MSHMPVEIINIGSIPTDVLSQAVTTANSLQSEFFFARLSEADESHFRMLSFTEVFAPTFLDQMESIRSRIKGYHPFLIAFVDVVLNGEEYSNLFAANRSESSLGIVTIANVPDVILPRDKMGSYTLDYLAQQTLGFIAPEHKNHDDTRNCVFDRKINKLDLLKQYARSSIM